MSDQIDLVFKHMVQTYAGVVLTVAAVGFLVGWVVAFGRCVGDCVNKSGLVGGFFRAIVEGLVNTITATLEGVIELALLPFSFRRVGAITRLCIKEAIRNKVLYVLAIFFLPFLFAGWYLPNTPEGQLLSLVAFVTTAMNWTLLLMALFTVSFSIPTDLKKLTIHTVVTKPVRRVEIVAGRILGYMIIFTIALVLMGFVSLIYVKGQVADLSFRAGLPFWEWRFRSPELEKQWTARVPVLARSPNPDEPNPTPPLVFIKNGQLRSEGTDVGKESRISSHNQGATSDSANWYFPFDPTLFAGKEDVTMELTFNIYKTTKGDPTRDDSESSGVHCALYLMDPTIAAGKDQTVHKLTFRVDNNRRMTFLVPGEVFKSGRLEVRANCLTRNQFLGMSAGDLYFLAAENSFESNFYKGLFSIWLKVFFVTVLAVSASTILNGFVTVLLTAALYQLGYFYDFVRELVQQRYVDAVAMGGGPLESIVRIVTHDAMTTDMEVNTFTSIVKGGDRVFLWLLDVVSRLIPNLTRLDTTASVAEGFDIAPIVMLVNLVLISAYVIPVFIAGHYFVKSREIAA